VSAPRLLAVGHLTRDAREGGDVLGGAATYAALCAQRLGWRASILTACGPDVDPERELHGIDVLVQASPQTTRFRNEYEDGGRRRQRLLARAHDIDTEGLPDRWREAEVLLLAPVAGEVPPRAAAAFRAGLAGAAVQGFLRGFDAAGLVRPRPFPDPAATLAGIDVVFLSAEDVGGDIAQARALLAHVPLVAVTLGAEGVELISPEGVRRVAGLPRPEVDPTGAGDVFAAAFLVRYHETRDPIAAAEFACGAASCAVEGIGPSSLGDRAEVERRLALLRARKAHGGTP
jgi:sugar/nucleoside kinase (ribokinase family)